MKSHLQAILLGVTLSLGATGVSQAMSELISMSADPVWPTSSTPDGNVVYNVTTVGRAGSGLLEVKLTAAGFPPGVTVTFQPSVLRFTGHQITSQTATMTVSCPRVMPIDCYPFTMTGTAQRESITVTNRVLLGASEMAVRVPTLFVDKLAGKDLRLRGAGAIGKTYRIEATDTLTNPVWTDLGSATADGNGRFTFFTAQTATAPMRFFRAVTWGGPIWAE